MTLSLENESLAECFNTAKKRRNDEEGEVALHFAVQAGGGAFGAILHSNTDLYDGSLIVVRPTGARMAQKFR